MSYSSPSGTLGTTLLLPTMQLALLTVNTFNRMPAKMLIWQSGLLVLSVLSAIVYYYTIGSKNWWELSDGERVLHSFLGWATMVAFYQSLFYTLVFGLGPAIGGYKRV
jgi:hypothetical protein